MPDIHLKACNLLQLAPRMVFKRSYKNAVVVPRAAPTTI